MQAVDEIIKKYTRRLDVALCVCSHRWFDIDAMTAAMSLFSNKRHRYTWMPVRGDALISRARSRSASFFLEQRQEDVLFFLDDDIVFTEEDATKLIDDVLNGCDIVGGMYVQKGVLDKTCVLKEGDSITFSKSAKPKEVLVASTGFMAIKRKVFEKIKEESDRYFKENPDLEYAPPMYKPYCHAASTMYYPFFEPFPKKIGDQWTDLSEDWSFCEVARYHGFKVWIDPSIFIGHKGEYIYDLRDKVRPSKVGWQDFQPLTLGE